MLSTARVTVFPTSKFGIEQCHQESECLVVPGMSG